MPGTFPSTLKPSAFTLRSQHPTRVSVAHNLKRQTRGGTAQRWSLELSFDALTAAQSAQLLGFLMQQQGRHQTFLIATPTPRQGAGGGTPLVNGATASGRAVPTDGWPASTTVLKAGDMIKFANHSKVYMVTADATSNVSGNVTLAIEPGLYAALADNEGINHLNPPMRVALAADEVELGMRPPYIAAYTLRMEEVL